MLCLVERRWNIPVLAALHEQSGAKFVTLANRLGAGRSSLSASLSYLIEQGFVRRNTGYGHPMRPEYLLTPAGEHIGAHCAALAKALRDDREQDLAYRKWTLPLVAAIGGELVRFRDLRDGLTLATPRAITLGLKSLLHERWAARSVIDDYPPGTGYRLLPRGRQIYGLLPPLAAELRR